MDYPRILMENISWSFNQPVDGDMKKFFQQLVEYNKFLSKDINPDEIVINANELVVIFYSDAEDNEELVEDGEDEYFGESKCEFNVISDNGKYFTCLELLYKIHLKIYTKLVDHDFKFFEGLELHESESLKRNMPVYILMLGS